MKRTILITLLLGLVMGSIVLAQCQAWTNTSEDPNDPNGPIYETALPSGPVSHLNTAADPNDPNSGNE